MSVLKSLFRKLFGTPDMRKMRYINWKINKLPYVTDLDQFGVIDRLIDIRKFGQGDCEDYAYAKMLLLREAGLVATLARSRTHAVCVCKDRDTGVVYVLDSMGKGIYSYHLNDDKMYLAEWRCGEKPIKICKWSKQFVAGKNPWH